jgi:predicted transposase YdaD
MVEEIKRLEKDKLTTEEYRFVSDLPLYEAYYGNMKQELEEEKRARREEQKARQEEHQKQLDSIEHLLRNGYTIESIANLLARNVEEIAGFVAEIEAKKE